MAKRYRFRAANTHHLFDRHSCWVANTKAGGGCRFSETPSHYSPAEAFHIWKRITKNRPDCGWVMEAVDD